MRVRAFCLLGLAVGAVAGMCLSAPGTIGAGGNKFVCPNAAPVYAAPVKVRQYQQYHAAKVIQVPVRADYYYSTNDYYRDAQLVDALTGRLSQQRQLQQQPAGSELDRLQADLIRLAKLQATLKLLQQGGDVSQIPVEQLQAPPPEMPRADDVNPALRQLISARCLRCHTEGNLKGGLSMDDLSGLDEFTRLKMFALVSAGEMPPSQGRIESPEEVSLFYEFAREIAGE